MIEIIILFFIARRIGRIAKEKGLKPLRYQVLLIVLWFFGEFLFGGFAYAFIGDTELACVAYLFAIIGALLGAGMAFLIVTIKKPKISLQVGSGVQQPPLSPEIADQVNTDQSDWIPATEGAKLQITSGSLSGQIFPLHDGIQVGRGSFYDVQLPDPEVSRQHLVLRYSQGNWYVQDQGSTQGTQVNGKSVQAIRLKHGDRISIGKTDMVFIEG
jgi:hypothetical protein